MITRIFCILLGTVLVRAAETAPLPETARNAYADLLAHPWSSWRWDRFVQKWLDKSDSGKLARFLSEQAEATEATNADRILAAVMAMASDQSSPIARTLLEKVLEANPNDSTTWLQLQALRLRTGDEKALLAVEQWTAPDAQTRSDQVRLLNEHGIKIAAKLDSGSTEPETDQDELMSRYSRLQKEMAGKSPSQIQDIIRKLYDELKAHPLDAAGWLAFSVRCKSVRMDDWSRYGLFRASDARPKSVGLLHEIARMEASNGLVNESLATLRTASPLDDTPLTVKRIAYIQIKLGSATAGMDALAPFLKDKKLTRSEVHAFADALCSSSEWEKAIALVDSQLQRWPQAREMRFLKGIALEESGRELEALDAMMDVLLLGPQARKLESASSTIPYYRFQLQTPMPPGTWHWTTAARLRDGYDFRSLKLANRSYYPREVAWPRSDGSTLWDGFLPVLEPGDLYLGVVYHHLHTLGKKAPASQRLRLVNRLTETGWPDAEAFLEAEWGPAGPKITPAMLRSHPDSLALHAAWWKAAEYTPVNEPITAAMCYEKLKDQYPDLALRAGLSSITGKETELKTEEILSHATKLTNPTKNEMTALISLLEQEDSRPVLSPKVRREFADLVAKWNGIVDDDQTFAIRGFVAAEMWPEAMSLIEKQAMREETRAVSRDLPQWSGGGSISGGGIRIHPRLPVCPTRALGFAQWPLAAFPSDQPADAGSRATLIAGLSPHISKAGHAGLRAALEYVITGQGGDELEKEANIRLQVNEPGIDDMRLGSWLAQMKKDWRTASTLLNAAAKIAASPTMEADLDEGLAACIERWVTQRQAPTEEIRTFIAALVARAEKRGLREMERSFFGGLAYTLGLEDLQRKLWPDTDTSINDVIAEKVPKHPYMAEEGERPMAYDEQSQRLARLSTEPGNQSAVVRELVRQMDEIAAKWLNPKEHEVFDEETVLKEIVAKAPQPEVMANAIDHLAKTNQAHLGAIQELRGEFALARQAYLQAANQQGQDPGVYLHLAVIPGEDAVAAARWMDQVPEEALPAALEVINRTLSGYGAHTTLLQRQHIAKTLSAWLHLRADAGRALPGATVYRVIEAPAAAQQGQDWPKKETFPDLMRHTDEGISLMRKVHQDLCLALQRFPETAQAGFGPLAGLAQHEGADMKPVYEMAVRSLRLLAENRPTVFPGRYQGQFKSRWRMATPLMPHAAAAFLASHQPERLETELLPLVAAAGGADMAHDARLYARLFMEPDEGFLAVAEQWIAMPMDHDSLAPSAYSSGGRLEEVLRIWMQRNLRCSPLPLLETALTHSIQNGTWLPEGTAELSGFIRYRDGAEEEERLILRLRDTVFGTAGETRRKVFKTVLEKPNNPGGRSPNSESGRLARSAAAYLDWLGDIVRPTKANVLVRLMEEDGLLQQVAWRKKCGLPVK